MQGGGSGDDKGTQRVTVRRERPVHAPSSIWLTVAFAFFTIGAAVAVAAVTASDGAVATRPELWITAGAFASLTVTCVIANWDVNRGRKVVERHIEDEELPLG